MTSGAKTSNNHCENCVIRFDEFLIVPMRRSGFASWLGLKILQLCSILMVDIYLYIFIFNSSLHDMENLN